MKKILFTLSAFLILSLNTAYANEPTYLKIGLKYGSKAVKSCTLQCDSGFFGYVNGEHIFTANENTLTIKIEADGATVTGSEIIYHTFLWNESVEIAPSDGGIITIDSTPYRGNAIISYLEDGLTVINCVELESYLRSVVPAEMPASWHIEAVKAQAVCARNYALTNLGKYKQYGFDMDDTVSNQVYKGVNSENENSDKAVMETSGISLLHDGSLVQTFFYSSGAGSTEDVKNVWGSNVPYLKSVLVPDEEVREWEKRFTLDEMNTRMSDIGLEIGSVKNIEITKRSETGRVTEAVITGENGSYTAKLERARTVFGLNSAMYELNVTGQQIPKPDVSGMSSIVKSAVMCNYNLKTLGNDLVSSESEFIFKGKGNGHGIGLSQYGAKALAENGYTYEQILTHFYTGSYIVQN